MYKEDRRRNKNKPVIFTRGEERFDLFVKSVFGFVVPKETVEKRDYIGRSRFSVLLPSKELLILLKAVTGRETDLEDITDVVKHERNISWDRIVDLAIEQKENNDWILIDLEEAFQKLKGITLIKQRVFQRLYRG